MVVLTSKLRRQSEYCEDNIELLCVRIDIERVELVHAVIEDELVELAVMVRMSNVIGRCDVIEALEKDVEVGTLRYARYAVATVVYVAEGGEAVKGNAAHLLQNVRVFDGGDFVQAYGLLWLARRRSILA